MSFDPEPGTIQVIPRSLIFGYTRTAAGQEAVTFYFDTEDLGAFNFLVSVESAAAARDELGRWVDDIDAVRAEYRAKFGAGQ